MRAIIISIFIGVFALVTRAQLPADITWTKISSHKGDFSVSLPSDFLVYENKEVGEVTIWWGRSNSSFVVSMRKTSDASFDLKKLIRGYNPSDDSVNSQFVVGDFEIATFTREGKIHNYNLFLASPSGFYSINVSSKDSADKDVKTFMTSILLNERPLIKSAGSIESGVEKNASATSLKTSKIIKEALKHKQSEKIKVSYDGDPVRTLEPDVVYSQPFLVLRKPRVSYTDAARQGNIQGIVKMSILFKGNGNIGSITVVQGLKGGLNEEAVNAAKFIKFLPAKVDGRPVDVAKIIDYTFTIY